MTDRLKQAFDNVRAEESLKADTLRYLREEIGKRKRMRGHALWRAAAACACVMLLSVWVVYGLYFTASAHVDVDVNPSVALTLNRFDRVIGVHAYNEDGNAVLAALSLRHRHYGEALDSLMSALNQGGYIREDGLVSVTLQADAEDKAQTLLTNIQTDVTDFVSGCHTETQIDVFSVSEDTWNQANALDLSPARYLAIQALIEVDPTATVEGCRGHSLGEIRRMARERHGQAAQGRSPHGGGHGMGGHHGG